MQKPTSTIERANEPTPIKSLLARLPRIEPQATLSPEPSNESSQRDVPSELEQFVNWYASELQWWSRLHGKQLDETVVETILEELLSNGYTLRDAMTNAVHERLLRHRWELNITVFYPDDKIVGTELVRALQRAYARGLERGRRSEERPIEPVDADTLASVRYIAQLQQRITELEQQLGKHNEKVSTLPKV